MQQKFRRYIKFYKKLLIKVTLKKGVTFNVFLTRLKVQLDLFKREKNIYFLLVKYH